MLFYFLDTFWRIMASQFKWSRLLVNIFICLFNVNPSTFSDFLFPEASSYWYLLHKTTTRCCSPSSNDSFSIESFLHSISLISVPFSFLYSISFSSVSLRSLLQEQAPARGRSSDSSPAMPRNSGAAGTLSSHHTNYGLIFCASHPFLTNLQRFFISAGSGPRVVKRPGGARLCPHPEAPPPPPRRRRRPGGEEPWRQSNWIKTQDTRKRTAST